MQHSQDQTENIEGNGGRKSDTGSVCEADEADEPILRYSRFQGAVETIVEQDSISVFHVTPSLVFIGSHNGVLYILNHQGEEIRRLRAHSAVVSGISIDNTSTHIASASMDGRVILHNLETKETSMYDFKRPVKCVAIDPLFAQNSARRFVSGGMAGRVILSEKGWIGNKETLLHVTEGPILNLSWNDDLIAWADERGVGIYHVGRSSQVGRVERLPNSPRADLFSCRFLWQSKDTLVIGWFDHITKVIVRTGVGKVLFLETLSVAQIDSIVCGIASFNDDLLIMAFVCDIEEMRSIDSAVRKNAERPELRIIDKDFNEISGDALGLRNYEQLQPNDYSLYQHPKENLFFVISPRDVVLARERDNEDHLRWLLENERFTEALSLAKSIPNLPHSLSYGKIGRETIDHMLQIGDFTAAAQLTSSVFMEDVELWEAYVFIYAEKGRLQDLMPYIPVDQPTMSSVVYEMILARYLSIDADLLKNTIEKWPVDIYDAENVITAIEDRLCSSPNETKLLECLATLYLKIDRPRDVLKYYLSLKRPQIFELVRQYHLFEDIQDKALELLEFNVTGDGDNTSVQSNMVNEEALKLLVDHIHSIPSEHVIPQISSRPALLYYYLRALSDADILLTKRYGDLQVKLYAEFDRVKLTEFLRSTITYSLEEALKVCEERNYVPELVFILARMGNSRQALRLIFERLGDVQQAVEFARSQADTELWEDLITYSIDKPIFIRGLLEYAGTEIDPIRLVRKIPHGLEVMGLKDSLIKIFNAYDLQMSLSQCGSDIHRSNIVLLALRLRAGQKRGLRFLRNDFTSQIAIVNDSLAEEVAKAGDPFSAPTNVVVFFRGRSERTVCGAGATAGRAVVASVCPLSQRHWKTAARWKTGVVAKIEECRRLMSDKSEILTIDKNITIK